MKWQNHILIGGALGAVINPVAVPFSVLGATAPDWIEYILKFVGINVRHRTVTHVVMYWLAGVLFFWLVWDFRHIGLGFALGGFSHVMADSLTIAGVPFSPWSDARFHLFGGKLRTGRPGEYIVAGLFAVSCFFITMYSNGLSASEKKSESSFLPFFFDWKGYYDDGLIDGSEWKRNRFKFF